MSLYHNQRYVDWSWEMGRRQNVLYM